MSMERVWRRTKGRPAPIEGEVCVWIFVCVDVDVDVDECECLGEETSEKKDGMEMKVARR